MKKIIKILIFLSIMIFIVPNLSHFYKSLIVQFNTLPKEYENVKTLEELTTNLEYTITSFSSIRDEYAKVINDSTFYISIDHIKQESPEIINKKIYKIDKKTGNIIDSISIQNENTYDYHHYLVNFKKGYFNTWLIDGDTQKKQFSLIENGKLHSKEDFKKYTEGALYSKSDFMEDSISKKRYVKTVFLRENFWYKINTEEDYYVNTYCCNNYDLPTKPIEEMTTLNHFFKTSWSGDIFPDFQLYFNGKIPEHWEGTAYYTSNTYNDINFKREEAIMYAQNNGIGNGRIHKDYQFYEDDSKKFLFISQRTGATVGSKHYLIQKK